LSVALLALTIAGAAYLAIALARVLLFAARPLQIASEFLPSMSVLKAVAGEEPGLHDNLASFCAQAYPDFEVIFCLHDAADPARATIERLAAQFPQCDIKTAIGNNDAFANPKIANLAKPGVEPRGEVVVLADSDIRVDPTYLAALASSFASERVGAATCLYGALPNSSLAGQLGALGIEDGFAPSVLVALTMGRLHFGLGATIAVRRSTLEAIGGLAAVGNELADDHALGARVAAAGYEVDLSRYVVRTTVPETALSELWSHELRWARTNFSLAPLGYIFSFLMYALPFALAYAALSRTWLLLAIVAALRWGLHYASRIALGVSHRGAVWLLPLRDFWSLGLWAVSLFGRSVRWRNLQATVARDGKLTRS